MSTITQIRSGLPVNVNLQGGTFGGFSFRPDIVPGVDPYEPSNARCSGFSIPDCQFNSAAFTPPPAGRIYGNAGRNLLHLFVADWAFTAGNADRMDDFIAVETFAFTAFFEHGKFTKLNAFKGGESR